MHTIFSPKLSWN